MRCDTRRWDACERSGKNRSTEMLGCERSGSVRYLWGGPTPGASGVGRLGLGLQALTPGRRDGELQKRSVLIWVATGCYGGNLGSTGSYDFQHLPAVGVNLGPCLKRLAQLGKLSFSII